MNRLNILCNYMILQQILFPDSLDQWVDPVLFSIVGSDRSSILLSHAKEPAWLSNIPLLSCRLSIHDK